MFGVFLILLGIGVLGSALVLLESVEQASIRRMNQRRAAIARERLEARMVDHDQAVIYDQEREVA